MRQITEQDELDKAHPSCVLVSSTGNINWGSELKSQHNQLPMDVLLEYEDIERLHDRLVNRDDQGDIGYTAEDIEKMGANALVLDEVWRLRSTHSPKSFNKFPVILALTTEEVTRAQRR